MGLNRSNQQSHLKLKPDDDVVLSESLKNTIRESAIRESRILRFWHSHSWWMFGNYDTLVMELFR